jgi:hypothetical protein
MTYLENLNKHIESKNYKTRTHIHFLRDVYIKVLSGSGYAGNIYSDIYNYIRNEK